MSLNADPEPPASIGQYRVLRKLGEGGMGAVFEAIHEAIQRRVAIKMLHPELATNRELVARFFNEARAVNLIGHPGIVQVSDLGHLPDGSAYLVMELLNGESLAQRILRSGGRLPVSDALQFAWQIADSLAAVHDKGIIHRDLKPANVMLVPDSHVSIGERTKLLDFGLAKVTQLAGGVQVRTKKNAVLGTPVYMSPEQCQGAGGVDEKTDVYALGAMLYEMLGGQPPFVADNPTRLLWMHMSVQPEPLRNLAPAVPKRIAEYVHRLLAKTQDQRPTMRQAASQLEALFPLAPPPDKKRPRPEAAPVDEMARTQPDMGIARAGASEAKTQVQTPRRRGWILAAALSVGGLSVATVIVLSARPRVPPTSTPANLSAQAPKAPPPVPDLGNVLTPLEPVATPPIPERASPAKGATTGPRSSHPISTVHPPAKASKPASTTSSRPRLELID